MILGRFGDDCWYKVTIVRSLLNPNRWVLSQEIGGQLSGLVLRERHRSLHQKYLLPTCPVLSHNDAIRILKGRIWASASSAASAAGQSFKSLSPFCRLEGILSSSNARLRSYILLAWDPNRSWTTAG